jgi:DnaJ-class molecular chaperone
MVRQRNHYTTLGVTADADQEVIQAAFRALAKKYHPDTASDTSPAASARFREINEAYSILSNQGKRADYDNTISAKTIDPIQHVREEQAATRPQEQRGVWDKVQYGAAALLVFGVGGAVLLLIVLMVVVATVGALRH